LLPPLVESAVTYSCLYALLALGLTLTYMTTRVPNFAHASFALVGSYVTWTWVYWRLLGVAERCVSEKLSYVDVVRAVYAFKLSAADYAVVILLSFFLVGALGVLQYRAVLKPLSDRGTSLLGLMIATIAIDMILFGALNIYADFAQDAYNAKLGELSARAGFKVPVVVKSRDFVLYTYDVEDSWGVPRSLVLLPLATAALLLSLHAFLTKTKLGVALRAAVENPALARASGVDVERIFTLAWFLSAGIAGAAGSLLPLRVFTNPALSQTMVVSIFASSIVGGLSSLYGAVLGGFLVGFSEVLLMAFLTQFFGVSASYRPLVPLAAIALTLLLAPEGIGGREWPRLFRRERR